MARIKTSFIDQHEIDLIHNQSLKSLQEIGIKVHSKTVLEILEKNGSSVDYDAMVAKIPENVVRYLPMDNNERPCSFCKRL
jgi:trimethylamine:corrinoid methyltransferase-like protein